MNKICKILILCMMLFAIIQTASAENIEAQSISIHDVNGIPSFVPADVVIPLGTTVTWKNDDPGTMHTVTSDTGVFGSGFLNTGQTFKFTFNNVGVFKYHCNIHPFMHGKITVSSSTPGITVASPNGGENVIRGTMKTITWSHMGNTGPNVKIELLKGGMPNGMIASNTPNDGSFNWMVPAAQMLGADYKIRITSTSNSMYTDMSNNNFKIAGINVNSPNGGENWKHNTAHMINWNSVGNPGSNVKIELWKGGMLNRVISSNTPNDGSYSWTIMSTQTLGNNYKIKIVSTSNIAYYDWSNNYFKIS